MSKGIRTAIKDTYLIANADDFGLDPRIDRGILESVKNGIVRSVSIVANGDNFDEAARSLKETPQARAGVHLCLVGERPVCPASLVPSLTDGNGALCPHFWQFFLRLCLHKIDRGDMEKELETQIRKVIDAGITPTHLDSHQYTHLLPQIFPLVIKLARKYGVKWIRFPVPEEPLYGLSPKSWCKILWQKIFSKRQQRELRSADLSCPDHAWGTMATGHLTDHLIDRYLRRASEGVHDLTCHPGFTPENSKYLGWRYDWESELGALSDQRVMARIKESHILITNYAL